MVEVGFFFFIKFIVYNCCNFVFIVLRNFLGCIKNFLDNMNSV